VQRNNSFLMSVPVIAFFFFLAVGQTALSQSARTWVSVNGNDANDCSRATPCRTLSVALSRSSAGGEIDVLDSGDFGTVTINKTISLISPGVLGGIQVGSGTAITVNAGASDKVVLRGLTIDGSGTGANGITFTAGGFLYVENCTVNNFSGYGIEFAPTSGSGKLFVTDSVIRNNGVGASGGGLHLLATTGPGFIATVDGLRSENNVFGVKGENLGIVTIRNSLAANNGYAGFSAVNFSGSGTFRMVIENSVATHNGTSGVLAAGIATLAIGNVVSTDNATGVNIASTATAISFGINRIWGNGVDVSGTLQNIGQQ
jgi:hypothetical protein